MDMHKMEMSQGLDPPSLVATVYTVVQDVSMSVDNQNQNQNTTETTNLMLERRPVKKEKIKREAIDGQAREVIFKVIKFFESEKRNRGYAYPVENVMKRASAATGLSESTIKRIKRDGLKAEATGSKMVGPKKKRIRRTKVQLDYYQLCALRGIVNGYSARKEVPTLGKILQSAKNELNYHGGKESLRLILLNKLGIKFKKCEKKVKKPPEEDIPRPMQPQQPQPQQQHQQQQQQQQQQMQQQPHPLQQSSMVMMPAVTHSGMMHQHMPQMKQDPQCVYTSVMPPLIGL